MSVFVTGVRSSAISDVLRELIDAGHHLIGLVHAVHRGPFPDSGEHRGQSERPPRTQGDGTLFTMLARSLRPSLRLFQPRSPLMVLMISLLCGTPYTFAQKVGPVSPETKTFKFGALEISVLRDSSLSVPNDSSIFGTNTNSAAVAKVLQEAGAPSDEIRLDTDTLLIRTAGHLVLIDTGYGPAEHGVTR